MLFFNECKEKKLRQAVRQSSLVRLSKYLLILEFQFDAILCSHWGNETSNWPGPN